MERNRRNYDGASWVRWLIETLLMVFINRR